MEWLIYNKSLRLRVEEKSSIRDILCEASLGRGLKFFFVLVFGRFMNFYETRTVRLHKVAENLPLERPLGRQVWTPEKDGVVLGFHVSHYTRACT